MLTEDEKRKLKFSLIIPVIFIFIIWIIWILDYSENLELYRWGIYPRDLIGLRGIVFAPLIHDGFSHLFANTIPILVLGTGINYFYRALAYKVIFVTWIFGGICIWIGARESYHIGASGLIYGLASFLFFSGIIRKDVRLAAISLLVVFLYGSMIWGIFPINHGVSWESHFFGGLCGLIAAIIYRKEGPQRIEIDWGEEDVEENESIEEIKEEEQYN